MQTPAERVWRALAGVHSKVSRALEEDLHEAGAVPVAWYQVLDEIAIADEPPTMTELADRVILSRPRVSRVVDELKAAGLVSKDPNPTDGRSAVVRMTELGRTKLAASRRAYVATLTRELGRASYLGELTAAIESIASEASPRR